MDKSEFLELNLPSRDNTTDIADINAISENFEKIDGTFWALIEEMNQKFQTKKNINLNFDDDTTNEEQYPSVPAVVNFTNRKVDPLKIINSASGNAIALKDSAKDKLKGLKLFGKTTQNGTPSPEAPVPLVSVGDSGSFEVGICSKNFFYEDLTQGYWDSVTKTIVTSGTYYPLRLSSKEFTHIPPNTKIYCMLPYTDENNRWFAFIGMYDRNKNFLKATEGIKNGAVFETPKDCYYITTTLGKYVNGQEAEITVNSYNHDICFNIDGIQNGVYEPFTKQTLTMPYTLRSVGDIKDEVDFNRGVLIQRCQLVQGFSLQTQHTNTKVFYKYADKDMIGLEIGKDYTLCSHTNTYGFHSADIEHYYVQERRVSVYLPIDFDNNMASEIKVLGVLATPIETLLTETELNAYRQLYTNKPNTTILSEADMEVSYVADTKLYIDNKISELTALTLEV